jgi:2-(1,2-epoxy-1,2-dihydrophenyl)acetyl-CoA isomerase
MSKGKVLVERRERVAIVALNEPETRNALSPDVVRELCAFLVGANADTSLSCIVLTGAGEGFCSGGNIKDMRDGSDPMFTGTPHEMQEGYRHGVQMIPKLFHALDVPVIAAVNGAAIGAGCDLACMCDIRFASAEAKFAESFMRVGLVSGDGGAWFLPRVVGLPRALEMTLTCRQIDANEALQWGLVTRVVKANELMGAAFETAEGIAALPPRSVRLNKRLIMQSLEMTLGGSLELSAAFQAIVQNTTDQKEAIAALLDKRTPTFVAR